MSYQLPTQKKEFKVLGKKAGIIIVYLSLSLVGAWRL